MKISVNKLILMLYIALTTFCSMTFEEEKQVLKNNRFYQTPKVQPNTSFKKLKTQSRYPRQSRQRQPPGLFVAVNSLIGGTVVDLFTGFRNLTAKIQEAFNPPKGTVPNDTSTETQTPASLRQVLGLVQSNFKSLRKTFDNEFTRALNDSERNVLEFRRELKNSKKLTVEYKRR